MPSGWDLSHGELNQSSIIPDIYMELFNYLFSDECHKRTTYKFGLMKSIIDCLYSVERASRGLEITYNILFSKFAEIYWDLIGKYEIRQIFKDRRTGLSKAEQLVYMIRDKNDKLNTIEFFDLSTGDRQELILLVKKECTKNVIGALYNDFEGKLYGFSHKEGKIWLHFNAYQYLITFRKEIEQLNYDAWATLMNKTNKGEFSQPLINICTRMALQGDYQKAYREILRNEFESNNCFFCGSKLGHNTHMMKLLPNANEKVGQLRDCVMICENCFRGS